MLERHITPSILKSMRDNPVIPSCLVEIKVAKKKFYLKQLKEHQRNALEQASKKLYWKIPDCGFQNLSDSFILKNAIGYLAIYFDKNNCYAIPIEKVKGNLSSEEAKELGIKIEI